MKKNLLVMAMLAMLGFSGTMNAQETKMVPTDTVTHVEFAPHWFLRAGGGVGYTVGEAKIQDLYSPAAALNVGYQFAPAWGVRLSLGGWNARGAVITPTLENYKFNYVQGSVDALLNLSNLFGGYKYDRTWNWYALAGVGAMYGFNNSQAVELAKNSVMEYLWEDHTILPAARVGAGVDVFFNDRIGINLEMNANITSDRFNSKRAENVDWQFNALAGIIVRLGKSHTKRDEIIYTAVKEEPKPVVVKEEPKPVVVAKPEVKPMTQNIFFDLNKSVIRDDQQGKVEELVAYLNKYPETKVTITGYADKQTGNAKINARLGEERSQAVAEALKAAGIAADRIVTVAKGDTEQPFQVNDDNRVAVCVAAK